MAGPLPLPFNPRTHVRRTLAHRLALAAGMMVGTIAGTIARPFRNTTAPSPRARRARVVRIGPRRVPRKYGQRLKDPMAQIARKHAAEDKRDRRKFRNLYLVSRGGLLANV